MQVLVNKPRIQSILQLILTATQVYCNRFFFSLQYHLAARCSLLLAGKAFILIA